MTRCVNTHAIVTRYLLRGYPFTRSPRDGPSLHRSIISPPTPPSFKFVLRSGSYACFWCHLSLDPRSSSFAADDEIKQYLEEDPRTNRIDDSLQLFTAICSNRLLKGVHLVLFLSTSSIQSLIARCRLRASAERLMFARACGLLFCWPRESFPRIISSF